MVIDSKILLLVHGVDDDNSPRADEIRQMYKTNTFKLLLSAIDSYLKKHKEDESVKGLIKTVMLAQVDDNTTVDQIMPTDQKPNDAMLEIMKDYEDKLSTYNDYLVKTQIEWLGPTEVDNLIAYIDGLKEKDLNLTNIINKVSEYGSKINVPGEDQVETVVKEVSQATYQQDTKFNSSAPAQPQINLGGVNSNAAPSIASQDVAAN